MGSSLSPSIYGQVEVRSPAIQRKRALIMARRARVAKLYLNRVNQTDIATALKVSTTTIMYDIRALNQQWYEEAMKDIGEHKARMLAELDAIIAECTTHLHAANRDQNMDSIWVTQWRTTLMEKAKVLGLMQTKVDLTSDGKAIGVREVIIELPPENIKQLGPG
jgi:transposase